MKRFLIELWEVLILCLLFPGIVIVFGAMDWSELLFKILDETEKEIKENDRQNKTESRQVCE